MRQRLTSEDEYLNVLADRFSEKSISSERTPSAILSQIVIQAFPPGATAPGDPALDRSLFDCVGDFPDAAGGGKAMGYLYLKSRSLNDPLTLIKNNALAVE